MLAGTAGGTEPLDDVLQAWVTAQQAASLSVNTIRARRECVLRFADHFGSDPRLAGLADVQGWLSRPMAANSRTVYFRNLRSFFEWLISTDRLTRSPLLLVKVPRQPKGMPRPVETQVLGEALRLASGDVLAWMLLAAYEGLRLSEVAAVRGEHFRGGQLYVVGKGDKAGAVPIHPKVAALRAGYPARGFWFPGRNRSTGATHVTGHTIHEHVTEHFRVATGTEVTMHALRHWFVTEVLRASGGNLRVAQELARHASVSTTELYTQVLSSERDAAVSGLPDLGGMP